jgi:hypothetical protein
VAHVPSCELFLLPWPYEVLQFGQPLDQGFASPLVMILELGEQSLLDNLWTSPSPKLLALAPVAELDIRQCRQGGLKLWQKVG